MTIDYKHIYAAITADIVGSTRYHQENGEPIRPKILDALNQINLSHAEELAVPFSITIGDEFQALVKSPTDSPMIIYHLRLLLNPLKCRIGVGIGGVVSDLMKTTTEMEGPAFSYSRDAIDMLKNRRELVTAYAGSDPKLASIVMGITALVDIIQNSWTSKQWEAVQLYDELHDLAAVGLKLGITPQSVEDRLRVTHWREVIHASNKLSELLDMLLHCSG